MAPKVIKRHNVPREDGRRQQKQYFASKKLPSKRLNRLRQRLLDFGIDFFGAFVILSSVHVLFSLYSPIQDCDEVFNFWEPAHYLNHGSGMQTWEYSPEYAIRSWMYIALHAVPTYLVSWLPLSQGKVFQFYFLRLALGLVSAMCEARMFTSIHRSMSPKIAFFFLISLIASPGMLHASVSFLPSTFAMWMTALAISEFLNWRGGSRTARGLMWLGIGTIVGWPFIAVLSLPFVFEDVVMAVVGGGVVDMLLRLLDGWTRSTIVLGLEVSIDTFFYKVYNCIPFNIIRYNVFSSAGRGPDIYGTEPWYFYINNLLINFNIWFLLAALSFPMVVFQSYIRKQASSRLTFFRTAIFLSPFYLWLAIFTLQPHKEERFMYPIYPCIALNAAVAMHIIYLNLAESNPKTFIGKAPTRLRLFLVAAVVLLAISLGLWRILGLATAYTAPLEVYRALYNEPALTSAAALSAKHPVANVCVGKEWYRFPSHYHLPQSARLKFIRSEFRGLLPGEFPGARIGFGLFPGAWLTPSGMNDMNIEDPAKYTPLAQCDYLVDSYFPHRQDIHGGRASPSPLEPDYVLDWETWERVVCLPFLDAQSTGLLGRLFWVPPAWNERVPRQMQRVWGPYCLLRRRR